jgi:hypothetical protein
MRRNPYNQPDPRKNPDDGQEDQDDRDDRDEPYRDGGIDPDPEAQSQRVSRRPDPDETEEIDLADDELEEMSEMEEEADARKGDGPDA